MFYKTINSDKHRFKKAIANCILIVSFLTSFTGCMTTVNSFVSPDSMYSVSAEDIEKIELKNGVIIDCESKRVEIEQTKNSETLFIIKTLISETKNQWNCTKISGKDIKNIRINDSELDVPMTLVAVAGVLAVIGAIALITLNAGFNDSWLGR